MSLAGIYIRSYEYDYVLMTCDDGSDQEWKYNPWGETEVLTDGNGHSTSSKLDAWGRAIKVTTVNEYEKQYTYVPSGNILGSHDFVQ